MALYNLKNKKIVIRSDGSRLIGMGHLVRSIAVAKSLIKEKASVFFCMRDFAEGVAFIKSHGFMVETIAIDKKQNVEKIISLSPDIVIHDFLETDIFYMGELKKKLPKCIFIGFDDLGSGNTEHHALFDANRPPAKEKHHFFGADYIILREEITAASWRNKIIKEKAGFVLVLFGGSDPASLTLKLVSDWAKLLPDITFRIVLGPGMRNKKEIESYFAENILFHENLNAKEMADLMVHADMALSSGGISMFELACLGVPSIVLAQNKAETVNMHLFAQNQIIKDMGLGKDVSSAYLIKTILELSANRLERKQMSLNGKRYVDGKGLKRIIEIVGNLVK